MKDLRLLLIATLVAFTFAQCQKEMNDELADNSLKKASVSGTYTVMVENVSVDYDYFEAGAVSIPEGESSAGPAFPGHSFTFSFHAGPNHRLSFATMYGLSNDGFYAPGEGGISLYSGGSPVTGDITSEIMLWDAGTQVNQMPGPSNPHNGADENGVVMKMADVADGYDYGTVATNLMASLSYDGNSMFTLTIEVLAGSTTAISPVAWVVHYDDQTPIFEEGVAEYEKGLEDLAETGSAGPLAHFLTSNSGYVSPVAPVLWVLHDKKDLPIFTEAMPDYGDGLETLAETGNPEPLYHSLMTTGYETGFQATREGGLGDGPLFPGQMYKFIVEGRVGQSLSIASMLGASNDIFFSTGDKGIKLSNGAAEKDLTHFIELYDAGTEVNEYPGAQTQANIVEDGAVRLLDDGLPWPDASQVIKVTIKKN
ncbi:spondin domain-containing protein [uncultured Sunxiuqinia sp.]|uniref:spondin domain-containing protein n=1 Tax=uncultured Sunxiuqinia sp. TaxID=1573825 RepID=UPI0030D73C9A|tara:strand:- start:5223 stop:6497 length:1275 start_codon:yes stop_codon:yes gene_type:complete